MTDPLDRTLNKYPDENPYTNRCNTTRDAVYVQVLTDTNSSLAYAMSLATSRSVLANLSADWSVDLTNATTNVTAYRHASTTKEAMRIMWSLREPASELFVTGLFATALGDPPEGVVGKRKEDRTKPPPRERARRRSVVESASRMESLMLARR